jgi:hypothetical protein
VAGFPKIFNQAWLQYILKPIIDKRKKRKMRKKIIIPLLTVTSYMQLAGQEITAPPENKAVVYFVRTSSLGFAINFTYFDSASVIGRTNGTNYMRYECEPGHHLFWARSENRDFMEAELEAGKIYFLEAIPQMGAIKAGVQLQQIDPANEKKMNKVFKLMGKRNAESYAPEDLEKLTRDLQDVIGRGLAKYKEEKEKGETITLLDKSMYYKK